MGSGGDAAGGDGGGGRDVQRCAPTPVSEGNGCDPGPGWVGKPGGYHGGGLANQARVVCGKLSDG